MRIDKYLWCIRFYKTRNLATEACKRGHIRINNLVAKPAREVYPTDQISIKRNQISYRIQVLDIPPSRVGAKLLDLYRKDNTPPEAFKTEELLKLAKDHYRKKGLGRPTKKDRRDLEGYTEWDD